MPILSNGFRLFFLGGALWAALAMTLWIPAFLGVIALPSALDPLVWHKHEMIFGYAAGVVAGFVLTAVPNWTGRLPVGGARLVALFILWLSGRLGVLGSSVIGTTWAAAIDAAFLFVLAGVVFREIVTGRNWRNLPVCGLITLFALANAYGHIEIARGASEDVAPRLGLSLLILLIALIGGRVVPSFTRNWMAKRGMAPLPAPFSGFDRVSLAITVFALLAWIAVPETGVSGALMGLGGFLNLVRMLRWQGWRTWQEPLVTVLHVGYFWLAAGLLLLGLAHWLPGLPQTAAVHALAAGAVGTMTLAIMTRASLGHTGRSLEAGAGTVAIYLMVVLGALLRVLSPVIPVDATLSLGLSAGLWGGAFLLFGAVYGPMLCRPRAGDA